MQAKSTAIAKQRAQPKAPELYAGVTKNRLRAMIDDVLELFERERASGKRDHIAAMADAYHKNPLDWMERVGKFLGLGDQPASVQNFNQFNGIFAQAAASAAERSKEITAEPGRVLDGCDDSQAVDW